MTEYNFACIMMVDLLINMLNINAKKQRSNSNAIKHYYYCEAVLLEL